jgi:hypothetical protein
MLLLLLSGTGVFVPPAEATIFRSGAIVGPDTTGALRSPAASGSLAGPDNSGAVEGE